MRRGTNTTPSAVQRTDSTIEHKLRSQSGWFRDAIIVEVALDEIDLEDLTFQYRLTVNTDDLRYAIAREGQLEPVNLLSPKPYRIIDGFRRISAMKELGLVKVRALIWSDIDDETALEIAFVKNVVRRNLRALEKGYAIRVAKERGCRPESIAKHFGLSTKQIDRYESLLNLPRPIQEQLDSGDLTMAQATVLATFEDIDIGEWVGKLREKRWSAHQLRLELRKARGQRSAGRKRVFLKCDGETVRMYPWRLGQDSTQDEKNLAIEAMERAISILREQGSNHAHEPGPRKIVQSRAAACMHLPQDHKLLSDAKTHASPSRTDFG